MYALFVFLNLGFNLSTSLNPSGFDQNIIGQRQDVICSVSVPDDVDPDTIELGWVNEDGIITDDNRVTIDASSDYFNDSVLSTIIQFDPLFEEDMGEYICYAIINGSFVFASVDLQNFKSKNFIIMHYVYTFKLTYPRLVFMLLTLIPHTFYQ